MSIYFGSTTDEELISELRHRGYAAISQPLKNASIKLAQKEIYRLTQENFGRMPSGDWENAVLDLRDSL